MVVGGKHGLRGQRIRREGKQEGGCLGNQYSVQGRLSHPPTPAKDQLCLKKSFYFRLGWTILLDHCYPTLLPLSYFSALSMRGEEVCHPLTVARALSLPGS